MKLNLCFIDTRNTKGSMKKNICLLLMFTFLSGCFGSVAFLGPASTTAASGASGNIARGAFTSTVSLGVKKQTGKLPIEHALSYADEQNLNKKEKPCLSFSGKTNSRICEIVKKQINKTKTKTKNSNLSLKLNLNPKLQLQLKLDWKLN